MLIQGYKLWIFLVAEIALEPSTIPRPFVCDCLENNVLLVVIQFLVGNNIILIKPPDFGINRPTIEA